MREVDRFVGAVIAVVSTIALGVWVYSIVTSEHHHPFNVWLTIFLVVLLASVLLWAWRRCSPSDSPSGPTFYGPVTFNIGELAPDAPPRAGTEPGPPPRPGEQPLVMLRDFVEIPERGQGPAVIRNREFENATLRGPIVLVPRNAVFDRVSWGVIEGDIETILWRVPEGTWKLGAVLLENCIFRNCRTEMVALGLPDERADEFRRAVLGR
jgi:hypothetical protein